jgi:WD40 repeat protein
MSYNNNNNNPNNNNSNSNYQGGGGGRGRGRGRGRGSGGRHGGNTGGRGGRGNDAGRLRPCGHFVKGSCQNGPNCTFAHVVKLHARLDASNPLPPDQQDQSQTTNNGFGGGYNNQNKRQQMAPISAISLWETQGAIKIFTGSHDGFWRLWNTSGGQFQKEFEHNLSSGGGKVECLQVASNFLFCGFEAVSLSLPNVRVGMIHAWNLANPTAPPLEFHMGGTMLPYAHATCVTQLVVVGGDTLISGCRSGVVRIWKFNSTSNNFELQQTIHGHAREITGLVVVDTMLWTSSIDGSIRLWDLNSQKGECKYVITKDTKAGTGSGHASAVTGLLACPMPNMGTFVLSSSLDGTIKAWNGANGECVASEDHGGAGVVSMALSDGGMAAATTPPASGGATPPAAAPTNSILLIGLDNGHIMVRNLVQTSKAPAFSLILTLNPQYSTGHNNGPVKTIVGGPAGTFYSGGADGKMLVMQIVGDLGI